MSRPKFCGFCGENLDKYDPAAQFCMNCGQPISTAGIPPQKARDVTAPGPSYGEPVDQRRTPYQPSYQPPSPYYRPPRPRIEYLTVSESLNTFLAQPREIEKVFQKISWRTILLIIFGVFFIEVSAIFILLTKVSITIDPTFIDTLLSENPFAADLGVDPEAFSNMFVGVLTFFMPMMYLVTNFITIFIVGFIVYVLMSIVGVEREVKNFRIAMTAVAFAFIPLLLFGVIQVVFAIIYPAQTIVVMEYTDIDFLAEPLMAFDNIVLLLGIELIFGIASSVYFFWGVFKGMNLENNKALVITLGYAIAFFYFYTSVISALFVLLFGI